MHFPLLHYDLQPHPILRDPLDIVNVNSATLEWFHCLSPTSILMIGFCSAISMNSFEWPKLAATPIQSVLPEDEAPISTREARRLLYQGVQRR